MSKFKRFYGGLAGVVIAAILLCMPLHSVSAQYGSDAYGTCAYGESCQVASPDEDLSNTGDNRELFIYGALILLGVGAITNTIRRKRKYTLKT